MILGIADDGDAASVGENCLALGNGFGGVVGPFAVNVRTQQLEQRRDRRLGKDGHVVHATQRGDQLRAIRGLQNRPARSLRCRHHIVVDGNDEPIGLRRRSPQIPNVTDMQQIEASVCERDRTPLASIRPGDLVTTVWSQQTAIKATIIR